MGEAVDSQTRGLWNEALAGAARSPSRKRGKMSKPNIGKNVDSWCTKCKMMLAHTIEAAKGDKITKVHCNTCGAQHAYRPNAPGKKTTTGKTSRAQAAKDAASADLATMLRGKDPAKARPYVLSGRFQAAELIRHPSFGLGFVTAVKDQTKIEVAFADGVKTLVQGHSA